MVSESHFHTAFESPEKLQEWMSYSLDGVNRNSNERDSKAFLNYLLDNPDVVVCEQELKSLLKLFLSLEKPDYRFQLPEDYNTDYFRKMFRMLVEMLVLNKEDVSETDDGQKHRRFIQRLMVMGFYHIRTRDDHSKDFHELLKGLVFKFDFPDQRCFLEAVKAKWVYPADNILLKLQPTKVRVWILGGSLKGKKQGPNQKFRRAFEQQIAMLTVEVVQQLHQKLKLPYWSGELKALMVRLKIGSVELKPLDDDVWWTNSPILKDLSEGDRELLMFLKEKTSMVTKKESVFRPPKPGKTGFYTVAQATRLVQTAPNLATLLEHRAFFPKFPKFLPELACLNPATVAQKEKLTYYEVWLARAPKRLAAFMVAGGGDTPEDFD